MTHTHARTHARSRGPIGIDTEPIISTLSSRHPHPYTLSPHVSMYVTLRCFVETMVEKTKNKNCQAYQEKAKRKER